MERSMLDADTFLTTLYVVIDDFCKAELPSALHPGPAAALSCSEVLTLAIFGQWQGFGSERGFYRYARRHLRAAFPTLPAREQFNRHLRQHYDALVACILYLSQHLGRRRALYEALDSTAVPTRDAKRRGAGWLPGAAEIGWSNRLGWFEGLRLLLAVTPMGAVTGFALAPGSTKDQPLADTFLALRQHPDPRGTSVGTTAAGPYVVDKGFEGRAHHQHWHQHYSAAMICSPKRTSPHPWPKVWRRWLAGTRQIVETVFDKLFHTFRLDRERPHALAGVQARIAAKIALHNFCLWLNGNLGRPHLAFAELVDW
jgi:Transposase DDE domain